MLSRRRNIRDTMTTNGKVLERAASTTPRARASIKTLKNTNSFIHLPLAPPSRRLPARLLRLNLLVQRFVQNLFHRGVNFPISMSLLVLVRAWLVPKLLRF